MANPRDRDNGLVEAIDTAPTVFDGKTLMIVDEVRSSGRTLQYAESFFRRAFPEAAVTGRYWMGGMVAKNGAVGNADLPVWYSDETILGRGIGNRNVDLSRASTNRAQKLGAWFLSSRLNQRDTRAEQLRREFHQLRLDIENHKVLVEPSRERDDADYDERALRLNELDEFSAYLDRLALLKK